MVQNYIHRLPCHDAVSYTHLDVYKRQGTIKGIKKGTAKITVTCNGVTKTVKVTVK